MTPLAQLAARVPPIRLIDPLAEFLGFSAAGEPLEYSLADAGKFAGHLCPTVATAYEMARRALTELFGDRTPVRGGVRVTVASAPDAFANGPLGQVIGYITGAAPESGFGGLMGRFGRRNLLVFSPESGPFGSVLFERIDTGQRMRLLARPERLPKEPAVSRNLKPGLEGDTQAAEHFREAWTNAVGHVIDNAGKLFDILPE